MSVSKSKTTGSFKNIAMSEILVDPEWNCRGAITKAEIKGLSKSIKDNGLLQPIVVVALEDDPNFNYKLIAGFRRHSACTHLKFERIEANVQVGLDEVAMQTLNLLENLQRENLPFYKEADAMRKYLAQGMTETAICKCLNMTKGWVQVRCTACRLPQDVFDRFIKTGVWDTTNIRDAYTHLNDSGEPGLARYVGVYVKSMQKSGGDKAKAKKLFRAGMATTKVELERKVTRNRGDLKAMNELLMISIGECLTTKVLAWSTGAISTANLHGHIKKYADDHGIEYEVPAVAGERDDE